MDDSKRVAKRLAEEAIVLLKNEDHTFPIPKGQTAAFFGRAQINTIYSGNGSGAVHTIGSKNILEECEKHLIFWNTGKRRRGRAGGDHDWDG